ncbi:MAG: acyl-CoA dehydratase activase [Desulfatibacillaceae bacterium]
MKRDEMHDVVTGAGLAGSESVRTLGICVGASSVTTCEMRAENGSRPVVVGHMVHAHEGDPKKVLETALGGMDMKSFDRIAVTGRKFRDLLNLTRISEPEAVEWAARYAIPEGVRCPAVVSAGGETFMVYALDDQGRIVNVHTGNKCASGTGEFFLQQLRRMDTSLDEAAQWAASENPHHVSGRCSVFCKSDCTHATNKGVPKRRVVAGLCRMMADKIMELLKNVDRENVMLTGGTSRNRTMVHYLEQELPGMFVPDSAPFFEAMGAALWAMSRQTEPYPGWDSLFTEHGGTYDTLPPLSGASDLVEFKTMERGAVAPGDECLLGLDVGSTTTKAVLVRRNDRALLASIYLRTNGDPVGASRQCYAALADQVREVCDPSEITIPALGVCGSGRQIAGLHALTDGVVNEIIAHAAAAVHFDPGVDTIFEIGGQDAKYTYLTSGVASDYAMNEACSAGTGSFLEESAYETLGLAMEEIANVAMRGAGPPNFNDQCAAFIASDIKNAIHEGVAHEDIVAGLVYSICMNYNNRVKGNRPVGEKVFMQGGVCYNHAVPLAMAALAGKPIVVPPEPGLMGAFGVALEVEKRMEAGLLAPDSFHLQELADREVEYGKSFICKGGAEKCDRRCEIAMVHVDGQKHPFGGACNRYYNLRRNVKHDVASLDMVRMREQLVFDKHRHRPERDGRRGAVAINRSFLTHTYFPLYSAFFAELGYDCVLPEEPSRRGIDRRNAAFCYPAELAHGFFHTLLATDPAPDFVFLPHVSSVYVPNGYRFSQVCPLAQGEPFYLKTTFMDEVAALEARGTRFLTPFLHFKDGFASVEDDFVGMARQLGVSRRAARGAYRNAVQAQERCRAEMREIGREALARLEAEPEKTGVVLFGRPYNAFAEEAHMGIPHKLASRGVLVMPHDFLDTDAETCRDHMYWGMGELILRGAQIVRRHPQLFGTYVTNFSCGPDSFVVGYFRQTMGKKPSLTLELDSHTADAGLETRIEAFLDVVAAYRQLEQEKRIAEATSDFAPMRAVAGEDGGVFCPDGTRLSLKDPNVTVLLPSMGKMSSDSLAAAFRSVGYNAVAHRAADEAILKLGRANTSCKECLPLILTTGTLLDYVRNHRKPGEKVVYFMPTAYGPCRFGQYKVFIEDLVRRLEIPDTAILSATSEESYVQALDSGGRLERPAWWGLVAGDVFEDIRSMLLANAQDPEAAMDLLAREWADILTELEHPGFSRILDRLDQTAATLARVPLLRPVEEVPVVSVIGEIFVRRDSLSRRQLIRDLAARGFAVHLAPIAEWVGYTSYTMETGVSEHKWGLVRRVGQRVKRTVRDAYEARIKGVLARSGLVHADTVDVASIVKRAAPYISPKLTGEAVLTVGSALAEVGHRASGAIAIGPFGCMPNRLSESVLAEAMNREAQAGNGAGHRAVLTRVGDLPFLAIESDGSPFPQIITAKLDAFCLRARRLHEAMLEGKGVVRSEVDGVYVG